MIPTGMGIAVKDTFPRRSRMANMRNRIKT
jgi:hypothetical protein